MNDIYKNKTVTDPVDRKTFAASLKELGVKEGMILEVHSSLSSFHYVIGGAQTIVDGLIEAVGRNGTILMPAQTGGNSEPSEWTNPPVSPELYKTVRDEIPAYKTSETDLMGMGAVAENFRHRPGVYISNHPEVSYAAWGRYARLLCNRQSLHFPLAEESPAARLYELKGYVLMIGTGFDTCTCMHLAEYRTEARPIMLRGSAVAANDGREWKKYLDLDLDSSVFNTIGTMMTRKNMVRETMCGGSRLRLFSANEAVDLACRYFESSSIYELYR